MKKALSIISSAVLTLALVAPAEANAQLAKKAGAPAKAVVAQQATAKKAETSRFHVATTRSAAPTSALRTSKAAAGAKTKTPAKIQKENVGMPTLYGSVIYNNTFPQGNAPVGLYQVSSPLTELLFEGPDAQYGGVAVDGVYYATSATNFLGWLFTDCSAYDVETGEKLGNFAPAEEALAPGGLTVDPTTGTVYGITYNASLTGLQLAKLHYSTTAVSIEAIADLAGNWNSIVCTADGQLYGISYTGTTQGEVFVVDGSALNKIDKATGEVTLVGETGQLPQYLSGAAIDPKSGRMFWNVCPPDESGLMCEVNLETGVATVLYQLTNDDEIMGMYIPLPAAEDDAPATVTELAVSFPEGALSGTVDFVAPTTLFDGTAATGELSYEVLANDEVAATGTTSFGTTVSAPVTLTEAGVYTFVVTVSNAAGKSPKAKVTAFVGKGTPKAPAATLTYANGTLTLTWEAVTESADGGYLNPAAVTYTVTSYPGAEVVEGISGTTFTKTIEEPSDLTEFYFTVVAIADGVSSAVATSNVVALGSIVPPYTNTFDSADALQGYTTIDANGDGKAWMYNNGAARIAYNSSMDMDDWLVTPPVKLEAGKVYEVTFKAYAQSTYYTERVEAKWGAQPTVEGLNQDLVEPTEVPVTSADALTLGNYIAPTETGTYYIGIHGISDADKYYLFVDDLTISAPVVSTVPGVCTDIVITPDPNGALKANVAFNAPAIDLGGAELAALTEIQVSRDGEVVKTFENPAIGAALSFEDEMSEGGDVVYSFQAFNADGAGNITTGTAFVGFAAPVAPEGVLMVETTVPGKVHIMWEPVTEDANGLTLPAGEVTYSIVTTDAYGYIDEVIVEGLTGDCYEFQAVPAGEQEFVQYVLLAQTNGGRSYAYTDMLAVGTPFDGMVESFADGGLTYPLGIYYPDPLQKGSWGLYTDEDLGIASQDGDNGFIAMKASYLDYTAAIWTGKIDLSNMENPGIRLYTYNIVGDNGSPDINEIQLAVKEPSATVWTPLGAPYVISELAEEEGWAQLTASLAGYAGQVVEVSIQATVKAYTYTLIDNIKVGSLAGHDLAATAINAPAKALAGETFEVAVTVANEGMQASTEATVELYADETLYATETLGALASGAKATVAFEYTMGDVATAPVDFYAKVVYAADENLDNNTTETVSVAPKYSNLPKVTDLEGESIAEGVKLTWSEPDLSNVGEEQSVDFEDATAWDFEYAGWTFIDKDESVVGGFQNTDLPGITPGATTASFFVFDASASQFNQTFAAHSGNMYIATLFRYDDGTIDDWAISPELDGSAQTVSFWAKSYSTSYPEAIEMLYSMGSTDTADFVKVGEKKPVPGDWTELSFDVPEGAKYFAIRSCATGSFMLMLDDFTFTTASSSANLSIVGYDVYRDGEKITAEPTGETEFVDTEVTNGVHEYVVVTVYTTGTSAPSNVVEIDYNYTGLNDLVNGALAIKAGKGTITVNGADSKLVTIVATDGKVVYSGVAGEQLTVSVPAGLYVVKADKTVAKVIVK